MRATPTEVFEAIQNSWKYALVPHRNIEVLVFKVCWLFICRMELHNVKWKPGSPNVFDMQQPATVEVDN